MKKVSATLLILALLCPLAATPAAAAGPEFDDVCTGDWFYEPVEYVTGEGLFEGTGARTFSPQGVMTRAMFVTVLGRFARVGDVTFGQGTINTNGVNIRGGPGTESEVVDNLWRGARVDITGRTGEWYSVVTVNGVKGYVLSSLVNFTWQSFSDVPLDSYCAKYVQWACENGIVSGKAPGLFAPNDSVTRQEMCVMLLAYSEAFSVQLEASAEPLVFTDDALISSWAREAVAGMQRAGVVSGREDGSFGPAEDASRCQVAAIFHNFSLAASSPAPDDPDWDGYELHGSPVPESEAVTADYFSDACFIGHSLIADMQLYSDMGAARFYARNNMTVRGMLDYYRAEYTCTDDSGAAVTATGSLFDCLRAGGYGKIYLMLGTYDMGQLDVHESAFYTNMTKLVRQIQEACPEAVIYLISATPVSRSLSEGNNSYTRAHAVSYNSRLQDISGELGVWYLDVFGLFADASGYLPATCTGDGIRLYSGCYASFRDFLLTHTAPV